MCLCSSRIVYIGTYGLCHVAEMVNEHMLMCNQTERCNNGKHIQQY